MQQTPGQDPTTTAAYNDSERERIEKRAGLVRKVNGIIWFLCGFLEVIIGMRLVFKLLGANPANSFVNFIYELSYPFVAPFFGIVNEPQPADGVFEVGSVIGMVVYLLIAWGLTRLLALIMMPVGGDRAV
jgi:hypothetical protein